VRLCGIKVLDEGGELCVQPFGARERRETRRERRENIFSNLIFLRIVKVEPNSWGSNSHDSTDLRILMQVFSG
jgi:hypothetical protein